MPVKTNILQMPDGTKFDAWIYIARIIELWNKGNIVNSIVGDTTSNVEAIEDKKGKIWRLKYYLPKFVDVQDRKLVVQNYYEKGHHERKPFILKPINIEIDREISTDIIQFDDWDESKLDLKIDQLSTVKGLFYLEPTRRRERIFFELHRLIAQIGEKEHTPKDGMKRIREIKDDATDKEITKAYQNAKDDLLGLLTEHIDGLEEDDIAFIMPPKHVTAISNTQALAGGSHSQDQLEKGQVGWLSSVKVYRTAKAEGIGYITIRGAAFAPNLNPEIVTNPAPSNKPAISFEWATVEVKRDKLILTDATIALGNLQKINADIRALPDKTPLVLKKPEEEQTPPKDELNDEKVSHMIAEAIKKEQVNHQKLISKLDEQDTYILSLEEKINQLQQNISKPENPQTETFEEKVSQNDATNNSA